MILEVPGYYKAIVQKLPLCALEEAVAKNSGLLEEEKNKKEEKKKEKIKEERLLQKHMWTLFSWAL